MDSEEKVSEKKNPPGDAPRRGASRRAWPGRGRRGGRPGRGEDPPGVPELGGEPDRTGSGGTAPRRRGPRREPGGGRARRGGDPRPPGPQEALGKSPLSQERGKTHRNWGVPRAIPYPGESARRRALKSIKSLRNHAPPECAACDRGTSAEVSPASEPGSGQARRCTRPGGADLQSASSAEALRRAAAPDGGSLRGGRAGRGAHPPGPGGRRGARELLGFSPPPRL